MTHPSKAKGNAYEALIAGYLTDHGVIAERIPSGATIDRGDLWHPGVTLQLKNHTRTDLPGWWKDTLEQRDNNGHDLAFIIHKRHGKADPAAQWATTDLATLALLLKDRLT